MDQRIESFLADVLALAGEEPDVVRDEVRVALGDYAAIFWAQEPNKLMKDKAARGCRVLCRDRVLAPVHCWFTEGFDTLDLKEAVA
jgi:hypothetical protein